LNILTGITVIKYTTKGSINIYYQIVLLDNGINESLRALIRGFAVW